ncbi:MAG: hypothetical protein Q9170_005369 [Blastenia crenularia]
MEYGIEIKDFLRQRGPKRRVGDDHGYMSPRNELFISAQSTAQDSNAKLLHYMNFTALMISTLELRTHDALYILDCCYACGLALGCNKELLASSACELYSVSTFTGFTRQLLDVLVEQGRRPITLAHIHAKLVKRWDGPGDARMGLELTPVHTELNPGQVGSLILAPMYTSGTTTPRPHLQRSIDTPLLDVTEAKVIISVHLTNINSILDVDAWVKWLFTCRPPYIREVELQVVSAHPASSTLILLMVPAAVYNTMHSHPAYSFVAYVR